MCECELILYINYTIKIHTKSIVYMEILNNPRNYWKFNKIIIYIRKIFKKLHHKNAAQFFLFLCSKYCTLESKRLFLF